MHQAVGYDGGKKVKGRKRFTLVDTLRLLMAVRVVAGNVAERERAKQLLKQVHQERQRFPRLVRIWADGGFRCEDFRRWVMDACGWILEVVLRSEGAQGFVLLPMRWTVKRQIRLVALMSSPQCRLRTASFFGSFHSHRYDSLNAPQTGLSFFYSLRISKYLLT